MSSTTLLSRPPAHQQSRAHEFSNLRPAKRRKDDRKDIWTSLLRQTREAQARNTSTQSLAHRSLLLLGGSPEDQRSFLQSLARPPPPPPPGRRDGQDATREKLLRRGTVNLSNRYAYGYGHITLYSPPGGSSAGGAGLLGLGQEAEEVARVKCHTIPEPHAGYEEIVRTLMSPQKPGAEEDGEVEIDEMTGQPLQKAATGEGEGKHEQPAVCVLLSWKEPWKFLENLKAWFQLLARALLPPGAKDEDPVEVLKEFAIKVSVVVQHTEAQMALERDGWKDDRFDYASQYLRTSILPLNAGLVYTSSSAPPEQPGSPLTDVQKVLFTSMDFDISSLSPAPARVAGSAAAKREDLLPKHNVVDRMAICVPAGWDSAGKIRLLSETFSPEEALAAWHGDLSRLSASLHKPDGLQPRAQLDSKEGIHGHIQVDARGQASPSQPETEVYGAASDDSDAEESEKFPSGPPSPSKTSPSAIASFNAQIEDPNAHKQAPPPSITQEHTPEQHFLAEMKDQLDLLEAQDAEKAKSQPGGTRSGGSSNSVARLAGLPSGDTSGALQELGDVSFNVGGVNYNTSSAEAAIASLRNRPMSMSSTPNPTDGMRSPGVGATASPTMAGTPRHGTPRPPQRKEKDDKGGSVSTPAQGGSGKKDDMPVEELEKYFASLMKKGSSGGGGSQSSTPTRH